MPPMLQYMSFWPQPNGAELRTRQRRPQRHSAFVQQSAAEHPRRFRHACAPITTWASNDTLSGAYTIDDGNSLVPLADPLFASSSTLRMQVASLQETHVFSPNILNTFRAGFSRAGFTLGFRSCWPPFPASLDFVTGEGPGGIVVGGGVTDHRPRRRITSAGPNNAAGVFNRRNLFTYADDVQISKGMHQISFGAWFQRMQDNEDSASRNSDKRRSPA